MEKLWINPRYGCKTVSSIIYVVGENCWEMVAWRMKSMFLCIKMIHDKVLVSSFFFPHPPTSPLLPTFPLYFSSSIPIAVTFVSYPECAVSSVRTTASFPLGKLCSSTFCPPGLGEADSTFSLLGWPSPMPDWQKYRIPPTMGIDWKWANQNQPVIF